MAGLPRAPERLQADLAGRSSTALVNGWRPTDPEDDLHHATRATKAALRGVARRARHLEAEIAHADRRIAPASTRLAPTARALPGMGPQVAAQLVPTADDNPSARAVRPPSPTRAESRHDRPAQAGPIGTSSTRVETATPTTRSC